MQARTNAQTSRVGWKPGKTRRNRDTRTPEQRAAEYLAMVAMMTSNQAVIERVRQAIMP